jgi:hypothetical protein
MVMAGSSASRQCRNITTYRWETQALFHFQNKIEAILFWKWNKMLSGLFTQRAILFSGKEERLFMEGVYSYGTRLDNSAGWRNWTAQPPAG